MNKNIEVINPHLWAVKFSWLPWLSDLEVNLDPAYSSDEQILAISDEGIVLLNKDNQVYQLYRTYFPRFQHLKPKILRQLLMALESIPHRTSVQEVQKLIIQLELERRKKVGISDGKPSKYN